VGNVAGSQGWRDSERVLRSNSGPENIGALMVDNPQSSAGIITRPSSRSVVETVDGLTRLIEDRGFMLFRVIDHSGTAERAEWRCPNRNWSCSGSRPWARR
jgi:hypothetical protein